LVASALVTAEVTGSAIDIGLVVRDIDRMLAFYRDHLGLPEVRLVDTGTMKIHFLQVGDARLKLVEHATAPDAANPGGGSSGASGLRYLTLQVASVDAALEGIEATGAHVVMPGFEFEGSHVALVDDPEGNSLELIRRAAST